MKRVKYTSNYKSVSKQMDGAKKSMLQALGKSAEAYVKLVTPVGQYEGGKVGGALRDSIDYKVDDNSVSVGSTLMSEDYPIYVHQGTSRGQIAQPYLRDGIYGNLLALRKIAERNYKL